MIREGSLPNRIRYFLLILSGLMLGFSFPPFPTGILAAFAFVPFFIAFEDIETLGRAFRSSYAGFLVFNLFSVWWVGGFVHARDPYLMVAGTSLVLGHPLFMFLPIAAFVLIRQSLGFKVAVFAFPLLWTSFEYLHSITQLAFPWLLLGNTQTYDLAAIQFSSLTGVYGVSFWLLAINVVAYVLYAKVALREWKPTSWQSIGTIFVIVALYASPRVHGSLVLRDSDLLIDGKAVRVGVVQPDIDPFEKWQEHGRKQLTKLQSLTAAIARDNFDLILWPETAIPFFVLAPQNRHIFETVKRQVDSLNVALLSGIPDVKYYKPGDQIPSTSRVIKETGQRYDYFNSSMLLQARAEGIQKYAKVILVPFGERVPYADIFAFAQALQWNFGLGGWAIGTDTTVFRLTLRDSIEVRFSNLICYESIYPGYVAEFVRRGAGFLTIITNDSWWGNTPGPYQHHQFAVFRAIENRRWIVRCANGGISCLIDPLGNIIQPTAMFTTATVEGELKARNDLTFYAKHGNLFAEGCLVFSALVLAAAFGKRFYRSVRIAHENN